MNPNAPAIATSDPSFGPIDVLILAAAIVAGVALSLTDPKKIESALGLGDTQAQFERRQDWSVIRRVAGSDPRDSVARFERVSVLGRHLWRRRVLLATGQVVLPILTLGAGLATFRHRVSWSRRALRYVGVLTTAVSSIFVALSLVDEFVLRRFDSRQAGFVHSNLDAIWWDLGQDTGMAIAAVWIVLALGRRWRSAPIWADRVGRLIGAGWIAFAITGLLLMYILTLR
jgi:hypothetical protein